jgi:hypothetical protein
MMMLKQMNLKIKDGLIFFNTSAKLSLLTKASLQTMEIKGLT